MQLDIKAKSRPLLCLRLIHGEVSAFREHTTSATPGVPVSSPSSSPDLQVVVNHRRKRSSAASIHVRNIISIINLNSCCSMVLGRTWGQLTQKKLLCKTADHALSGPNSKVAEYQSGAAVGGRIV